MTQTLPFVVTMLHDYFAHAYLRPHYMKYTKRYHNGMIAPLHTTKFYYHKTVLISISCKKEKSTVGEAMLIEK